MEVINSCNEVKTLKKDTKSHTLSYCNQILQYFKIRRQDIVYCELHRNQFNLMYSAGFTLLSLQGITVQEKLFVDNTRRMGDGELMTGVSRVPDLGDVTLQHKIRCLKDLLRDCKVDKYALKYDTYLRNQYNDEKRQQLGICKYIISNKKFDINS